MSASVRSRKSTKRKIDSDDENEAPKPSKSKNKEPGAPKRKRGRPRKTSIKSGDGKSEKKDTGSPWSSLPESWRNPELTLAEFKELDYQFSIDASNFADEKEFISLYDISQWLQKNLVPEALKALELFFATRKRLEMAIDGLPKMKARLDRPSLALRLGKLWSQVAPQIYNLSACRLPEVVFLEEFAEFQIRMANRILKLENPSEYDVEINEEFRMNNESFNLLGVCAHEYKVTDTCVCPTCVSINLKKVQQHLAIYLDTCIARPHTIFINMFGLLGEGLVSMAGVGTPNHIHLFRPREEMQALIAASHAHTQAVAGILREKLPQLLDRYFSCSSAVASRISRATPSIGGLVLIRNEVYGF